MVNYSYNSKTSEVGPTWYHTDHLGSTNLLTDEGGDVIQHTEYYPYGETRVSEGEDITQYKFTGQEFDPETGLYYYGARYYDPVIARFISADSIVPDPTNPQDFNRYTYVRNNPIIYTDPTGHFLFSILVSAWLGGCVYAATADNATISGFFASMIIGAYSAGVGAAAGGGTYALLGKTALARLGVGGSMISGALAGAVGLGASYSTGVALAGGQWTWKGFGIAAGIGFVTGAIAGYFKSPHLQAFREGSQTFWGGTSNIIKYQMLMEFQFEFSDELMNSSLLDDPSFWYREMFASPVEGTPQITSIYGIRDSGFHGGYDIHNPEGHKVFATETSIILKTSTCSGGGGNCILMRGLTTGNYIYYMHTENLANIKAGDIVFAGQAIGKTDLSGLDLSKPGVGPHLHFTVQKGLELNTRYDPIFYFLDIGIDIK